MFNKKGERRLSKKNIEHHKDNETQKILINHGTHLYTYLVQLCLMLL